MSGKRTDKLYGRIAAITAIRTGMANVLVVNTLDRSSRSMADGAKLVADSILVSKVWSLRHFQGDSPGIVRVGSAE